MSEKCLGDWAVFWGRHGAQISGGWGWPQWMGGPAPWLSPGPRSRLSRPRPPRCFQAPQGSWMRSSDKTFYYGIILLWENFFGAIKSSRGGPMRRWDEILSQLKQHVTHMRPWESSHWGKSRFYLLGVRPVLPIWARWAPAQGPAP